MASMLPEMKTKDDEIQLEFNLQDVNLQKDDGQDQEVSVEVAIHQPNRSISFKRGHQDQHQKISNTIKDLIDEMDKATKFQLRNHTNQKNKAGKRINMKRLEKLF